jgi:hypothetical protein
MAEPGSGAPTANSRPRRTAVRRAVLALVLLAPLDATAQETPLASASVEIINRTRWAIYELYLSPSNAEEWGDDQLDGETIEPGDHFTLTDIPCEVWDVLLIDEDGDHCVVLEVDFCHGDYKWVIENDALLECQGQAEAAPLASLGPTRI